MTTALRVAGIGTAAPDVRTVHLEALDGRRLPSFTPGSHVVLDCGGTRNAYSLTGPTVEPRAYSVSVLHVRDGRGGSSWVHRDLAVGQVVTTTGPRSAFPPVLSARHHLLVAGGIGVTAVLSHVRSAIAWGRSFSVLYSYREGRAAHLEELRELCGERLQELTGRGPARRALQRALGEQPLGSHVYTCGPPGLIDTVAELARAAGWPEDRVHVERFGSDEQPPGRPFSARLASTGRRVDVSGEESLLEALEAAGASVPSLCRRGVCGECRVGVRSGRVDHRDLFLTAAERAAGDCIMACVSRSPDTLELDL